MWLWCGVIHSSMVSHSGSKVCLTMYPSKVCSSQVGGLIKNRYLGKKAGSVY